MMKFKVEAHILNETIKCRENFSCLTGNNNCLCEVDHVIGEELVCIKPIKNKVCDYKYSYGYSYYCICPTRKEIYRLYRI